jgi:FAD/FMN-containing dehydrogenase
MQRRHLLLQLSRTAAALAWQQVFTPAVRAQPAADWTAAQPLFTLGVASGEPRADSVVLWTRLAVEPVQPDGGMPSRSVPVQWEIATDERFAQVVQAGMTLAELEALAARDRLWCPLTHPWREATVGGVVASGWNGPARWRFGAIRDLVLGGAVVLPDGRNVRIGGKVVKNVAGYDMTKLHVGALGTLGVLTEVNLKLAALPAAHAAVAAVGATAEAALDVALRAFRQSLVASSVLVFGGDRGGLPVPTEGAATVVVTAAGHPADVAEELRLARGVVEGASRPRDLDGTGEDAWSEWHRRRPAGGVLLRIGVPNARLADVLAHPALESAPYVADVTAGIAWADCPPSVAAAAVGDLQAIARAAGGYAAVLRAPPSLLAQVAASGHVPTLATYMERLRGRWDPNRILNPGRFDFAPSGPRTNPE